VCGWGALDVAVEMVLRKGGVNDGWDRSRELGGFVGVGFFEWIMKL